MNFDEIYKTVMIMYGDISNGFKKISQKQNQLGTRFAIVTVLMAGYVIFSEKRNNEQKATINKLGARIEMLECRKGEQA